MQRAYQQETAEYKKYGGPDGVNEDEEDGLTDEEELDSDDDDDEEEEEEELDEKTKRLQEEVYKRFNQLFTNITLTCCSIYRKKRCLCNRAKFIR